MSAKSEIKNIKFNTLLFFIIFLSFFLSLNSYAKRAPDWVMGISKKYPSPQYFIGVGGISIEKSGKKQRRDWAADMARAEVAKTLRVEVQVEVSAKRVVKGGSKRKSVESISRKTDIIIARASEVLEGVEIKEYYKDKKSKMIYALAVLDRIQAVKRLNKKVVRHKGDALVEMEAGAKLQDEGRYLLAIRHYEDALISAKEATSLKELVDVLRPTGPRTIGLATGQETEIKKILYALKRMILFKVNVEGPARSVRTYVLQGLSKSGYVVTSNNRVKKVYVLNGVTDITYRGEMNMGSKLNVRIFQADLDITVQDSKTGDVVGVMTWSVSANEKSKNMAKKSAVRALGKVVREQVSTHLINVF